MDIFSRLKQDHDKHRAMLERVADTSGASAERREAFEQLRLDVSAHANAEEQSLYAEMLSRPVLQDKGRHSVAEHKEADDIFEELTEKPMDDSGWLTRFKTLKHKLEHHMDEEENDIFPPAKEGLSEERARELTKIFNDRKPEEKDSLAVES
ncbi:MAG: hemerythrin domain-containing protein [Pseudomonadota bacterium]